MSTESYSVFVEGFMTGLFVAFCLWGFGMLPRLFKMIAR
jgi:hypothetical protein